MTFYGNRHLVENSKLPQRRKDEALKVYDLISEHTKTKVMTHVTVSAVNKLAKAARVQLQEACTSLEDLSAFGLLDRHATFTAEGDEEDLAVDVPYFVLKKAIENGYFDHPDGRGRITERLVEGCYFYFSLEERPASKTPQKKAVCASTTRHFSLELSMSEFVALCRSAGHDVPDDAHISFKEAGAVHRLTVGDSIAVRWTKSEKGASDG